MGLSPDKALRLAAATLGYGVLEAIEATGLACQRRWAEWLTVLVTASLLPFEVYELVRQPTVVKVAMLAINVAVLAYLVARRLNGHHRPHRQSWQLSLARSV